MRQHCENAPGREVSTFPSRLLIGLSTSTSTLMGRVVGVSQKSLTATLRHPERDGLVKRTVTVQVPIRVDYEATPLGKAFVQETHPLWI